MGKSLFHVCYIFDTNCIKTFWAQQNFEGTKNLIGYSHRIPTVATCGSCPAFGYKQLLSVMKRHFLTSPLKSHLKALVYLYAFEESVDCHLLSSFCDDSNLHISLFTYVLSTMGVSKESISKFLIGNRFHVKLRILSPENCKQTLWVKS